MGMGRGSLQLLQAGEIHLLASVPQGTSYVKSRRNAVLNGTGRTLQLGLFQHSLNRHLSFVANPSYEERRAISQSRRIGIVSCSDSSLVESVSEPLHNGVDSSSSPSLVVSPFTEAGIEVVRSIEEAENEVLRAVSGLDQGETDLPGDEATDDLLVSLFEQHVAVEQTFTGQTQLLTALEHPSSAVAASLMVSEVASALKSLEKEGRESQERDLSESEDETPIVDKQDKLMIALEQLTSAVEPALMVTEVADILLPHIVDTNEDALLHEKGVLDDSKVSAGEDVGGEKKNLFEQLQEIVAFAGPALAISLSGPLMSLIDTSVVGNSSSVELAALGPGTVICDQICCVFLFLSMATSNLIATSLAQKDREGAAGHLSRLLFVSFACGLAMFFMTRFGATTLLTAFVGGKNADLVPAALPYVQIRALAWPAVLVGMVAQSACLGMQDAWGPLKVLGIASLVNLVGDILLCTVLGYGIAGAAWATMASQYVAGFFMLRSLNTKGYNPLAISVPSWKEFSQIVNLAGPVLLTMLSKVMFYTLITYLATSLGPVTLAGHQVMIGVYCLCTVWGEPLAQTAQSFMPALICGVDCNLKKARELLGSLMMIGAIVGLALGCIAVSVPWFFPQVFTRDLAIVAQMRAVSVPFVISLMITPPTLALEGTLMAGRDMKFLGLSMASCFVGGSLLLLTSNRLGLGLQGSWWTLAAFQWTRFFQSYSRLYSACSILADPILTHEEGSLLKIA